MMNRYIEQHCNANFPCLIGPMSLHIFHLLPIRRRPKNDIPNSTLLPIIPPRLPISMMEVMIFDDEFAAYVFENGAGDGEGPVCSHACVAEDFTGGDHVSGKMRTRGRRGTNT